MSHMFFLSCALLAYLFSQQALLAWAAVVSAYHLVNRLEFALQWFIVVSWGW